VSGLQQPGLLMLLQSQQHLMSSGNYARLNSALSASMSEKDLARPHTPVMRLIHKRPSPPPELQGTPNNSMTHARRHAQGFKVLLPIDLSATKQLSLQCCCESKTWPPWLCHTSPTPLFLSRFSTSSSRPLWTRLSSIASLDKQYMESFSQPTSSCSCLNRLLL
jgi:hypothetical protein